MGDIVLSWTTSTSACDWECLSLLDGLNCMLWSYFRIQETPKLHTKVIVVIMESFLLIWNLIRVDKQVKTCMQRGHGRLRNLIVRILFVTSVVYTILLNYVNRMVMETLFWFTIWLPRIGKVFLMMIRILKRALTIP